MRLRGPIAFVLLAFPLILTWILVGGELGDGSFGSAAVVFTSFLLARFVLGTRSSVLGLLAVILGAGLLYPVDVYGQSWFANVAIWVARFSLAAVILFCVPYLFLRPHQLLESAFPAASREREYNLRNGLLSLAWTLPALAAVLASRYLLARTEVGPSQVLGWGFGTLYWVPLLLLLMPPACAIVVHGLEKGSIWAILGLMGFLTALDALFVPYGVLAPLFLFLVGVLGGAVALVHLKDVSLAVLAQVWSVGMTACVWSVVYPQPDLALAELFAVTLSIAFLRGFHLEKRSAPLVPFGASFRAVSPLHWLWDLSLPLLRKLDGPGPVWD